MEQFKKHVQWKDGRYHVKPLLKKNFKPMKNNYNIALRRYHMLRRQLQKDKAIEKMYSPAIENMIERREVEWIDGPQQELKDPQRFISYIPHFGVLRLD